VSKLPVLFVSCHAKNLMAQGPASSGPARMIWGKRYESVVVIRTASERDSPEIHQVRGEDGCAEKIHSLLVTQGFAPDVCSGDFENCEALLGTLLAEVPEEVVELILNTGMSELEYRRVGLSLEALREHNVLIICLDDKAGHGQDSRVSLYDHHLRELLNSWVQDQQWGAVMSFKGDTPRSTQSDRVDDPTVCLLNAAFTLGGSQFPHRMFSSGMNNTAQMLSGFGWMR